MSEEEVARLTSLLRDAIKLSKTSNRAVERQLGLSSGYLSRLFAGVMELRVQHILDICGVISFAPGEFFRAAYPSADGQEGPGTKLRQALERLHPVNDNAPAKKAEPAGAQPADAKINEEDMEKMLLSVLRRLLTQGPEHPDNNSGGNSGGNSGSNSGSNSGNKPDNRPTRP